MNILHLWFLSRHISIFNYIQRISNNSWSSIVSRECRSPKPWTQELMIPGWGGVGGGDTSFLLIFSNQLGERATRSALASLFLFILNSSCDMPASRSCRSLLLWIYFSSSTLCFKNFYFSANFCSTTSFAYSSALCFALAAITDSSAFSISFTFLFSLTWLSNTLSTSFFYSWYFNYLLSSIACYLSFWIFKYFCCNLSSSSNLFCLSLMIF